MRRFALAMLFAVPALAVTVIDAFRLVSLQERDRVWHLGVYAALPAVALLLASPFMRRWMTLCAVGAAAAVPPIVRFAEGGSHPDAMFDRLALNSFWFVLVWLPLAVAAVLITGPPSGETARPRFFRRRLWRPGAAFLLVLIALTFTEKEGLSPEGMGAEFGLACLLLLAGIGLLVSDLLPPRSQWIALQWTWMLAALLFGFAAFVAMTHLNDLRTKARLLESEARSATEIRSEMNAIAARHDKRGALPPEARTLLSRYDAEYQREAHEARAALEPLRPRLPVAAVMLAAAIAFTALFIALSISARRRRPRRDERGATAGASSASVG